MFDMSFEWDSRKSGSNKVKHGIDFEDAQALWADPNAIIAVVMVEPEPRWIVIGLVSNVYWTAVVTYRGSNIRLISCRRSRKKEIEAYEKQKN